MPGRSIVTNLLFFNNFITNSLNNHHQLDVAYTDFPTSFNSTNHALWVEKLKKLNINKTLSEWIIFSIVCRKYKVLLKDQLSSFYIATSGVPQGSHLGLFLFIIFINDIANFVKYSNILIFADNVKIFRVIKPMSDFSLFQRNLEALNKWSVANKLFFSLKKCGVLTIYSSDPYFHEIYKIQSNPLLRVSEERDLPVIYNNRFYFDDRIQFTVAKAYKKLGIFKYLTRNFNLTSTPFDIIELYESLILPLLLFNLII